MIFRFGTLCAVLFIPAVAFAQMIQAPGQPATGPYTDAASGFTFPAAAGEFKRFRITRGPADSISAGYAYVTAQARMVATVFVDHPSWTDDSCQAMANAERRGTLRDHPQAVFAELVPPPVAGYVATAFSIRHDGPRGAEEHYYYCRGGWVVEFDFQHPPALDAESLEAAFLRDLRPTVAEKH